MSDKDFNPKPLEDSQVDSQPSLPEPPRLEVEEAEVEEAYPSENKPLNRNNKTIPLIILGLVIIIGLGLALILSGTSEQTSPRTEPEELVVTEEPPNAREPAGAGATGATGKKNNRAKNKQNQANKNKINPNKPQVNQPNRPPSQKEIKDRLSPRTSFSRKPTVKMRQAASILIANNYNPRLRSKPHQLAAMLSKRLNYRVTANDYDNPKNLMQIVAVPELGIVILLDFNSNGFPSVMRLDPWKPTLDRSKIIERHKSKRR